MLWKIMTNFIRFFHLITGGVNNSGVNNKRKINRLIIGKILSPLAGYADNDDEWPKFDNLNPNDESAMRSMIREYFLPYYHRCYPLESMLALKEAFMYFLSVGNIDWQRECDSLLFPCDLPDDSKNFALWLWDECFPNTDYHIANLEDYYVVEDYDDLHKVFPPGYGWRKQ